jgi:hypothetical protein
MERCSSALSSVNDIDLEMAPFDIIVKYVDKLTVFMILLKESQGMDFVIKPTTDIGTRRRLWSRSRCAMLQFMQG